MCRQTGRTLWLHESLTLAFSQVKRIGLRLLSAAMPTSKTRAASCVSRPLTTRFSSPKEHTTTPNAISSMFAVTCAQASRKLATAHLHQCTGYCHDRHRATGTTLGSQLTLTELENFSVPNSTPEAYTKPGISDFVIWMKDTDRYRYEAFDSHRLAAYSRPAGSNDNVSTFAV